MIQYVCQKNTEFDKVLIPGYDIHVLNMKEKSTETGIHEVAKLIRKSHLIEFVEGHSKNVLWCKLDKAIFVTKFLVGLVYLPMSFSAKHKMSILK